MDDSESLGDLHSTNQLIHDFSESSEVGHISAEQLSTMVGLNQPLILTSAGIPLATASNIASQGQGHDRGEGQPVLSFVGNSDDLSAQFVDLNGDYQPVIETSADQLHLVLNRLAGAYGGEIDLQSILRSLNQSISGSDQLTVVFSSLPTPAISASNELTLVYSNGQPVIQSSLDSDILNQGNIVTLASTTEVDESKQLIGHGSMDGSVAVKLDLDGATTDVFNVSDVIASSNITQYVNMPITDIKSEQLSDFIAPPLPEAGPADVESLQTSKNINKSKRVIAIKNRTKRQGSNASNHTTAGDGKTVTGDKNRTVSNDDGDIAAASSMECSSDLQDKLESVNENIKLLKKKLETVVSRKTAYLRQVEELAGTEQELLAQLRIETSRSKALANKLSATGGEGTNSDVNSTGGREEVGGVRNDGVSGTSMTSTQLNDVMSGTSMTSTQLNDGVSGTSMTSTQLNDVMSYLQPIETQMDVCADLLKDEEKKEEEENLRKTRRARGRKKKMGRELQLDIYNDDLTALDDSLPDDDETKKKKRQRTKVASRVPVKCDTCNRSFRISYHLQRHKNNGCDGNQSHTCEVCGKEFMTTGRLKAHSQTHVRGEHNCPHCGRSLASRYQLLLHVRQHEGDLRQLCSVCGKAFVDYHALRQHMVGHTRPHSCDICGRRFSRVKDMRVHRRLHTGECFFSCPVCRKSYATATMLRRHQLTHNPIKEQICGVCQRGFHHISELRIHMRIHTGEEVYKCVECNIGFNGRYQWNKHQWDVHNVPKKTRSCEMCGKVCTTPSNLRNHLRSHSMEKPHKCLMCEKQYKNVHDLMVHEKKKHSISHKDFQGNKDPVSQMTSIELTAIQVQPFGDIQLSDLDQQQLNGLQHQQLNSLQQQQLVDLQQLGVQQFVDVQQLSTLQQQLNAVQQQLGVVTTLDQFTTSDIRII